MPEKRRPNSKKRNKPSPSRKDSRPQQVRVATTSSQTSAAMRAKRSAVSLKNTLSNKKQDTSKSSLKTTKTPSKSSAKAKQTSSTSRVKAKQRAPRTETQYTAKPEKFKETWDNVLATIAKMRRERVSLSQASREIGISPRTVTKWGKSALQKNKSGKYKVKQNDLLLRMVRIPSSDGMRDIAVRGSKQVTLLAEYSNALHRYLQTGDAVPLKKFAGKIIKDADGVEIPLLTDLSELNRLGSAGVLSFESIYARTT